MWLQRCLVQQMTQPHLSLEQQFSLRTFETQVQQMNREQAQALLVNLYKQMIERENMYKHFLAHQWGLDVVPAAAVNPPSEAPPGSVQALDDKCEGR